MKLYLKYLAIMVVCTFVYMLIFGVFTIYPYVIYYNLNFSLLYLIFFIINIIFLLKKGQNINKYFLISMIVTFLLGTIISLATLSFIPDVHLPTDQESLVISSEMITLRGYEFLIQHPIIIIRSTISYAFQMPSVEFIPMFLLYKLYILLRKILNSKRRVVV